MKRAEILPGKFPRYGHCLLKIGVLILLGMTVTNNRCIAQELRHRPTTDDSQPRVVALVVPEGTPLSIALNQEVHVERAGQPVQGRLTEPVYAFSRLVMPAGSKVTGEITRIEDVPAGKRTLAALNADFTPYRKVDLAFDNVQLPDGTDIPIKTQVTPGSGHLLDFVAATSPNPTASASGKKPTLVRRTISQMHQQWSIVVDAIKSPGRFHRAKRYVLSQLPVHPQFIEANTIYFAQLQTPVDFGTETLRPGAYLLGALPDSGITIRARLANRLSSAIDHNGDIVRAVVSQPVFEGDQLIVPEGSILVGHVVQARPARRFSHNGELRIVFQELLLPENLREQVEASLESIEADRSDNVKLDSEGGAHANAPRARYLSTAVALSLAGLSFRGDPDAQTPNPAGSAEGRVAGGAVGYKLIGIVLGLSIQSRAFGYSMGVYGASISVYSNFVARGRDVTFPQGTAMQINLGQRQPVLPLRNGATSN